MRGLGRVYRPVSGKGKVSLVWWLDYGVNGKQHRESSGTRSKKDAMALLRERISKRTDGSLKGRPDRVTLAELTEGLGRAYALKNNASWDRAKLALSHIADYFGEDARAIDITRDAMAGYQEKRIKKGTARNTVKYETGVLRAAFTVAVKSGILSTVPIFPAVAGGNKRSGFFGAADFAAVILELPAYAADVVRFARATGWRRGEVSDLLWSQVEWDDEQFPGEHEEPVPGENACIRITADQTKGSDEREFPFYDDPELKQLMLARWRQRDGLRVFHRKGKHVGKFRKSWATACRKAGVDGRVFHDLRRTAARDFRQEGVSEGQIMSLCGWKTRAMFDRYNIISNEDRRRAVRMRANGKITARTDVPAVEYENVSQ